MHTTKESSVFNLQEDGMFPYLSHHDHVLVRVQTRLPSMFGSSPLEFQRALEDRIRLYDMNQYGIYDKDVEEYILEKGEEEKRREKKLGEC